MPATPTNVTVFGLELFMLLAGLVLLWRHVLRPAARAEGRPAQPLIAWEIGPSDFATYLFGTVAGGVLTSFAAGLVLGRFDLPPDTKAIINSATFQLGLLLGPALFPLRLGHHPLLPPLTRSTLLSGLATFLIALPVVTAVNYGWLLALKFTGLPTDSQELLRLVAGIDSPALLALFVLVATVVAPLTEELVFRAGLFRYFRNSPRVPRWAALLVPAAVFALFHFNLTSFLPLLAFAIVLSLAYERTGRIGTAIIAHGLFNLHTVVLVLAGVTQ